jgi:hypothetical protein
MNKRACKRKTCPDKATRGHVYCGPVCRFLDQAVMNTLGKGDRASVAELSALLGVVDSVNLWRCAVMAENRNRGTANST